MEPLRKELAEGVFLTYVPAAKFKTGVLGAQLITPLEESTVAAGALLPAVLRRGTTAHRDMRSIAAELDRLYGASIAYTVRKKGENQCLGFVGSFLDERYVPGGERLLEPMADLLGELLLDPLTRNGRFLSDYVESEKENLIDAIESILNDKRDYADARLLQEMCRGERYGIDRLGTVTGVERLTNQTLYRYYSELLATARIELFYCGSADCARVEGALDRALAALPRERVAEPAVAERVGAPETVREITETMDVTQAKLAMGYRAASEDTPALLLANLIFGGYSNSKLFLNVREKLSLCYYASSTYVRSKGILTVSSGIEAANYDRAVAEIMAQLEEKYDGLHLTALSDQGQYIDLVISSVLENLLFGALLATMMIPGELFTITNYQTIFMLGWQNTYTVLIVPFLVSVFYIYLLRQNFLQIPNELYLAAKVDSTSDFKYMR